MKNLFLHESEKYSPLQLKWNNELHVEDGRTIALRSYLNIYITSDEEIKDREWALLNGRIIVKYFNPPHKTKSYRKIILTTDKDLIKDGVQEIDDEFLEWFVKNPTCEFIDWGYKSNEFIQKEIGTLGHDEGLLQSEYDKYVKEYGAYEIIIPSVEQTKC